MVSKWHSYQVSVSWTGNRGEGTSGYRAYGRSHEVTAGPADQGHDSAGPGRPSACGCLAPNTGRYVSAAGHWPCRR